VRKKKKKKKVWGEGGVRKRQERGRGVREGVTKK